MKLHENVYRDNAQSMRTREIIQPFVFLLLLFRSHSKGDYSWNESLSSICACMWLNSTCMRQSNGCTCSCLVCNQEDWKPCVWHRHVSSVSFRGSVKCLEICSRRQCPSVNFSFESHSNVHAVDLRDLLCLSMTMHIPEAWSRCNNLVILSVSLLCESIDLIALRWSCTMLPGHHWKCLHCLQCFANRD